MSTVKHLTDMDFWSFINKAQKPVIVDFWAEWCGPCKAMAPILEDIAESYGSKISVTKLNIDENPNTAMQFRVRNIPALFLFINGQLAEKHTGFVSLGQAEAFIKIEAAL